MSYFYDGISIQNRRKCNMDSLLLKERSVDGTQVYLAAVCDGVGSLENGAFASSAAIRMLNDWFSNIRSLRRLGLQMRDAVLEINHSIVKKAMEQDIKTATTLSAILLAEDRFYIVHTGDSRIYSWRHGRLTQLTEDQSLGGRLTACLGHSEKTELYYNEGILHEELFLVCSDGLYKRMNPEFLSIELKQTNHKTIRKTMERLIHYVTEQGESDNISLAVVLRETEGG